MNYTVKINTGAGITFPKGFKASGIHCGLRKNKSKKDLALILSDTLCDAAAIYTTNKVYGAPIKVTRQHLENGKAKAVICNSGNANTCNPDGVEKANAMCKALADYLKIDENDVVVASTGVIGQTLEIEPIINGIPELVSQLDSSADAGESAAAAIMTTDTEMKQASLEVTVGDKKVRLGAIAKGSGMISPNMATMLCFITTDVNIDSEVLCPLLKEVADKTFNMISIDGDTSTNDTLCILASGLAQNQRITECSGDDFEAFRDALEQICLFLTRKIASDGEGATKLLECSVRNFSDYQNARVLAKSVINSPLVKTAMFGSDANWGRVLCALGYAGVDFDPERIDVKFISSYGEIEVCKNGNNVNFDEDLAKAILSENSIIIDVNMNDGDKNASAYGCDLSYDYVRINGDYRS